MNRIIRFFNYLWWKITDNGRRTYWAIPDNRRIWNHTKRSLKLNYSRTLTRKGISLKDFFFTQNPLTGKNEWRTPPEEEK